MTSRKAVLKIMFLFGVEKVPMGKFIKAVGVLLDKYNEGFRDGTAVERKRLKTLEKIKKILRKPRKTKRE